ncbi:NUMOD4 motif-containing HNH endonuclease [Actinomycetospora aeridis]|uniref:NUMOD4 motif-containing HNH endonuclease n=1 Tax=Actinomycetospora aeridis TaxID=3129231 RepID=UPI0035A0E8C1
MRRRRVRVRHGGPPGSGGTSVARSGRSLANRTRSVTRVAPGPAGGATPPRARRCASASTTDPRSCTARAARRATTGRDSRAARSVSYGSVGNDRWIDETTELWLPIAGYEGDYEISDQGRVRRVAKVYVDGMGRTQVRHGRLLRTRDPGGSYARVNLGMPQRTRLVHRLVCEAFHGAPPDSGTVVRHLDGDPTNNQASNVRWGTALENADDTRLHGRHSPGRSVRCRRGHLLRPPNLRDYEFQRGRRRCLSCRRAMRDGTPIEQDVGFKDRADALYAQIMAAESER